MKLKKFSFIYSIYNLINSLITYIKDKNTVKKVFYSDDFKLILNTYLNTNFKNDWIGRIYGVINPNININGKIDFSNTIIELNDEYSNDDVYVNNWIYRQLNLMNNALKIKDSSFFDYVGMSIEKIEPMNQNNYLIIFQVASQAVLFDAIKHFLKILLIDLVLISIVLLILTLI